MSRFYVQDEGVYVPTDDMAQAFAALNFIQENSLGIGTDTLVPVSNPDNPGWIADIKTKDLWGFTGVGTTAQIYRLTDVGIGISEPNYKLDVSGTHHVTDDVQFDSKLNVDGDVTFTSSTSSTSKDTGTLVVSNGGVGIEENLNVGKNAKIYGTEQSTDKDTGALVVDGGVGIEENLNVGGNTKLVGTLELESNLIDVEQSTGIPGRDFRLSAVADGVKWRPPGVETQNAIWVTKDGNDANTGLLEGDAKATIGAAAAIAQPGDTIFVRSGTYVENNPIGLRRDVSVSGQDLRLVTVIPQNTGKDVFHVRRGCLIENLSFAKNSVSISQEGGAAVAFPPIENANKANSGFIELGPTDEGPSGRWKSPYIRNCTNFMTESIGMKIDGNHAVSSTIGADLKCMVCDSFTQYNENGIGVSITNNGYAQLVSIFTINSHIAIYADTGGSCDLTNSNSSFGNYGLVAVGLGSTEFTGTVGTYPPDRSQPGVDAGSDKVTLENVVDSLGNARRPYDGQALFFEIDLTNYGDVNQTYVATLPSPILTEPMLEIQEIVVENGGTGFSPVTPPTVIIRDADDLTQDPKGPQGIIAELSPTIDAVTGEITAIDVVNSGRNYLPSQNLQVFIDGGDAVGAKASVITKPIYYTVDVATNPTSKYGKYADAISLIEKNKNFIATEAVDRMLFNNQSFTIPGGNNKCVSDVLLILDSIISNLGTGGNSQVYDAAKIYIDNDYLNGEESQSIETFNYARDLAKLIINNQPITKQSYTNINSYEQIIDLTIIADPSTGSNQDPNSCSDVKDTIDSLFSIITTAISSNTLPQSRTIGSDGGVTTVTFNEFIPYELYGDEEVSLKRISRILTSSHSFEYIGTGVDINTSTPFKGSIPIKENEIVALDGGQVPFTSTDQKGNFDIGEGFQINQPTSTIRGRDFSKAIQAEVTPLILALR